MPNPFKSRLLLQASSARFTQDNPEGSWLEGKRELVRSGGRDSFGAYKYTGPVTGYFNRPLLVATSLLKNVPGMRGEQSRIRHDDLNWLTKTMRETNMLPVIPETGKQYCPYIMVDCNGEPWVNEGNHRIMAAVKLGWKCLPVEIRYFTGGELFPGHFSPSKLLQLDSAIQTRGYYPLPGFRGDPTLNDQP